MRRARFYDIKTEDAPKRHSRKKVKTVRYTICYHEELGFYKENELLQEQTAR